MAQDSGTTSGGWSARRSPALAASRLAPGATWRLATDWADYADQMREVLDAEPALEGGLVPRWEERPVTRFERKGLEAGRTITDLAYAGPRSSLREPRRRSRSSWSSTRSRSASSSGPAGSTPSRWVSPSAAQHSPSARS